MGIGDKAYKLIGVEIREYQIIKLTWQRIQLLDLKTNKETREMTLAYFEQWFCISKIYLLRELLGILETKKGEVVEELGEYDLRCMLGEIIPDELLKNLK